MQERDGYPEGVPCWVDTGRVDPQAALAFYGGLFGWEFEERTPTGSSPRYHVAQVRGRDVAGVAEQPDARGRPAWNTYVWVASADETAAAVTAAGGRVVAEPHDVGNAGRTAAFADPGGASFCVWQANESRGAQLVNEPGTWVSSELNTPDPETAKAFYGSVFGWEASDAEDGLATLRRPGYGDHLAHGDPGLRPRLAEWNAPEGFEDTVAWMRTTSSDGEASSFWGTTFSVADADTTAERAAELGGRVVVAPFDTQWVRIAVLGDPDGGVFGVARFTPPS